MDQYFALQSQGVIDSERLYRMMGSNEAAGSVSFMSDYLLGPAPSFALWTGIMAGMVILGNGLFLFYVKRKFKRTSEDSYEADKKPRGHENPQGQNPGSRVATPLQ